MCKIPKGGSRNGTADLLKGFAVLFMIQVHIMEQFASLDTYNSLIGKIALFLGGPPCAPVFLAVMGYFLATSSRSFSYFMKRGVLLFVLGIVLNILRSSNLLIGFFLNKYEIDPWFYILGADILTLAGISMVITGFLRVIFINRGILYILLAIAVTAISPLIENAGQYYGIGYYVTPFLWGHAEWSYFPVFPWFAYILTGYSFNLVLNHPGSVSNFDIRKYYLYFIGAGVFLVITAPYATGITSNLKDPGSYYHHGPLFFIWILIFMMVYLLLINLVEKKFGKTAVMRGIKWIGKEVTLLYFIQWIIIGNLATMLYRSQDLLQSTGWVIMVIFLTLLTGYLFSMIWKKVKSQW